MNSRASSQATSPTKGAVDAGKALPVPPRATSRIQAAYERIIQQQPSAGTGITHSVSETALELLMLAAFSHYTEADAVGHMGVHSGNAIGTSGGGEKAVATMSTAGDDTDTDGDTDYDDEVDSGGEGAAATAVRVLKAPSKMDSMGWSTGRRFVEWFARDRGRVGSHVVHGVTADVALDAVKFLCKEVWQLAFGKAVDNLKTNHRGVFVVQDNQFRWLARFVTGGTGPAAAANNAVMAVKLAPLMSWVCGFIRGVLDGLLVGAPQQTSSTLPLITCHVEMANLPQCTFKLEISVVAAVAASTGR